MKKKEILEGDKFGKLKVLSEIEKRMKMRYFTVECEKCGRIFSKPLNGLLRNKGGCLCDRGVKKGTKTKPHRLYRLNEKKLIAVFNSIRSRCSDRFTGRNVKYYSGKGIKCEWNSFEEFYNDMGEYYQEGLSIDRIDNNGNYCKENCRWTDIITQNNNRSNNIIVEGGLTLKKWTESIGCKHPSQYSYALKLYKAGLSLDYIANKIKEYKPHKKE